MYIFFLFFIFHIFIYLLCLFINLFIFNIFIYVFIYIFSLFSIYSFFIWYLQVVAPTGNRLNLEEMLGRNWGSEVLKRGTLNVRGENEEEKREKVGVMMEEWEMDILALTETELKGVRDLSFNK